MFQEILQQTLYGNRVSDYFISLGTFLGGIIVIQIFKGFILNRLHAWAEKTAHTLDDLLVDVVGKKALPLFYAGVFYLSIQPLALNPALSGIIRIFVVIVVTIYAVRFLMSLLVYVFETYWLKKEQETSRRLALRVILTSGKIVIWTVAIIILMDNLGIKVSALVAGLGIGGLAIGFAVQAILKDLFNYFVIFFDRPFELGDFIIIGDYMGTVDHVGIKTTRLTSLSGEQLVFSNTDLTDSRIRNYKKMSRRRVVFRLGVIYQTSTQQMKEIPGIITDIIKGVDDTVFDRAHFFSYGDFSLVFEVVYYVLGNDYNKYMNIQQEINFKIMEEFEKRGIEFAYPTQTLFISKVDH